MKVRYTTSILILLLLAIWCTNVSQDIPDYEKEYNYALDAINVKYIDNDWYIGFSYPPSNVELTQLAAIVQLYVKRDIYLEVYGCREGYYFLDYSLLPTKGFLNSWLFIYY